MTNQRKQDILRWIALLPATYLAGLGVVRLVLAPLGYWFFANKLWMDLPWNALEGLVAFTYGFGIPYVIMFYVAYSIAPKHKISTGCWAAFLCFMCIFIY